MGRLLSNGAREPPLRRGGRGLAWLPRSLIAEDLASSRLVEAAPDDWHIDLEIRLYRARSPLGTAAEDFWKAVCSAAPQA